MTISARCIEQESVLQCIADILRDARRVLAICHITPDGDAVGSLLGLGWLLRNPTHSSGQRVERVVTLACADEVPVQFQFLPGAAEVVTDPLPQSWDTIVTVDASDPRRLGLPFQPGESGGTPIINLDHHVTNLCFGTLNYVDTTAAATAQIIVHLADALEVPITREAAVCLLTGLVTDTLSFRTSNVTPQVMLTTKRLMEAGADLAEITERALNQKPLGMMRLWGLALVSLRYERHVIWTRITREMRSQVGAPDNGDAGLASYLISAPEANVSAVFSEKVDGQVEVGFRARPGYDVSALALSLGGGGHPQAAGCIIPGPVTAAEEHVLPLLFELVGGRLVDR